MIAEPNFESEKELENAIAIAIQSASGRAVVLRGFGLDLAVFSEGIATSHARFLEIKAFSQDNGRCGFGNGRGEGNQVRLLFDEAANTPRDQSQLSVFDRTVRWVLGNRSAPIGSPRLLIFTCKQAQDAAVAGVRPGKQNNLNLSRFRDSDWITWPALIDSIVEFINGTV
jgi:hypothetical protein